MNRDALVKSLATEDRSEVVCKEVIEATFEYLSSILSVEQGVTIDGLGVLNAHYKRKAVLSKQTKRLMEENLSIYYHPSREIKKRVKKMLDNEQAYQL